MRRELAALSEAHEPGACPVNGPEGAQCMLGTHANLCNVKQELTNADNKTVCVTLFFFFISFFQYQFSFARFFLFRFST